MPPWHLSTWLGLDFLLPSLRWKPWVQVRHAPSSLPALALLGSQAASRSRALPRLLPTSILLCSWRAHQAGLQPPAPWTQRLSARETCAPSSSGTACFLLAHPIGDGGGLPPGHWAFRAPTLARPCRGRSHTSVCRPKAPNPLLGAPSPLGARGLVGGDRSTPAIQQDLVASPFCQYLVRAHNGKG